MTFEQYIMRPERSDTSIFDQNREGIASVLGFFSIYLVGVGLGRILVDVNWNWKDSESWRRLFLFLASMNTMLWTAYMSFPSLSGTVSRRLVNLPYMLWTCSISFTMLLLFLFTDLATVVYTENGSYQNTILILNKYSMEEVFYWMPLMRIF